MKKPFNLILICLLLTACSFSFFGCKNKEPELTKVATYEGIKYELIETVVTNTYRYNGKHENYYTVVARIHLINVSNETIKINSGNYRIKSHNKLILNNEGIFMGMPEFVDSTPSNVNVMPQTDINLNLTMNLMPLVQSGEALNTEAQKKFLQDCNKKLNETKFTLYCNDEKLIDFGITKRQTT